MPRGPLPTGNARRGNAPTIAGAQLPKGGRTGRVPKVPEPYKLAKAGTEWWKWAWKTPQADAWDKGAVYFVLRRAQLEDDLTALSTADDFSVQSLLTNSDQEQVADQIDFLIRQLKRLAGGEVAVMKEMRELDNRLGLNPKAMAELRWSIKSDEDEEKAATPAKKPAAKRRPKAVDPKAK